MVNDKILFLQKRKPYVITLSKSQFLYFLLLIWHFQLGFVSTIPWLDKIFTIGKILSFSIILIMVCHDRKYQITNYTKWIFMYSLLLMFSTVINRGALVSAGINTVSLIAFSLILEYMLEKKAKESLKVLMFSLECIIYVNFVTVILFPTGLYNVNDNSTRFYWLLGHQNITILYVLCACLISILYSKYIVDDIGVRKNIRPFLLITISCITIIKIWSATAIAGLFIMFSVLLINKKGNRLTIKHSMWFSAAFFVLFVILRLQEYFSVIIVEVLHRDLTFSDRTDIWDAALYFIKQKPFIGYGVEIDTIAKAKFGFATTHNKFLHVLYQGGIGLLFSFIMIIYSVEKKMRKYPNSTVSYSVTAIVWALLIQMQFESYTYIVFYLPFIVANSINSIENIRWKKEKTCV